MPSRCTCTSARTSEVTDAELAAVNIIRDEFHPDWNYTIHPSRKTH